MMKNNYSKNIKFFLVIFILFFSFFIFAQISHAYTEVYFQNQTKEIIVGDTFSIDLKIASSDKQINVIDGIILYDKDKLEIKEVKINDSLFSLWVQEPIFDNEIGELSFIGGVPNGFQGQKGQILKIIFLAKKKGETLIGFQDIFSVFLNDGRGTQINPWLRPLSLTINQKSYSSVQNIFFLIFILILLFIIIKLFIKFRNKKHEK